jgi:hypothetical protein
MKLVHTNTPARPVRPAVFLRQAALLGELCAAATGGSGGRWLFLMPPANHCGRNVVRDESFTVTATVTDDEAKRLYKRRNFQVDVWVTQFIGRGWSRVQLDLSPLFRVSSKLLLIVAGEPEDT